MKVREFIYGVRLQWQRRFAEWLERGPLAPLYSKVNAAFWRLNSLEEKIVPVSVARAFSNTCDEVRRQARLLVEVIVEHQVRGAVDRLAQELRSDKYSSPFGEEKNDAYALIEQLSRDSFAHNGSIGCLTKMITDLCIVAGVRPKLDRDGNYVGLEPLPIRKPIFDAPKKRTRRSKKA